MLTGVNLSEERHEVGLSTSAGHRRRRNSSAARSRGAEARQRGQMGLWECEEACGEVNRGMVKGFARISLGGEFGQWGSVCGLPAQTEGEEGKGGCGSV